VAEFWNHTGRRRPAFRVRVRICGGRAFRCCAGRYPEPVDTGYLRSCSRWLRIDRQCAVECELRRGDGGGSGRGGGDGRGRARPALRRHGYGSAYHDRVPA